MSELVDAIHAALVPLIAFLAGVLLLVLAGLVVHRLYRDFAWRRSMLRRDQCLPYVEAWLAPAADDAALDALVRACGGRRRAAAAALLLAPLRSMSGGIVGRSRTALERLGLCDRWLEQAHDRRWWIACDAVQALGLVRHEGATTLLLALLDDGHPEIRAVALDALGRIATR